MARDGEADAAGAVIYLDYQATTPLAPQAFEAMVPWLRDSHANPHSPHREGRRAKAAVEVARHEVLAALAPGENGRLFFTSGATEAANWAIAGAALANSSAASAPAMRPVRVLILRA